MLPLARQWALELPLRDCEVRRGSVCRSDTLFGLPNIVPAFKLGFITLWAFFIQAATGLSFCSGSVVLSSRQVTNINAEKGCLWMRVMIQVNIGIFLQTGVLFRCFTCRLQHCPLNRSSSHLSPVSLPSTTSGLKPHHARVSPSGGARDAENRPEQCQWVLSEHNVQMKK